MYTITKRIATLFIIIFWSILLSAQETINVMSYNLLEFPEAPPSNRVDILKVIIDNYQPDLFMVCELQSETGANMILNTSLQTSDSRYAKAEFVYNQSSTYTGLQQLTFYNKKKLVLISQDIIKTNVRDINHYVFKINSSYPSPPYIDVFVAHLKSSQGFDNELQRLEMVQDFTTYLSTIPTNHYVLIGGDFNLYTSSESAYQELLDPTNSIILKDPINRPGSWNNNSSFQDIHTQSTRLNSFTDGSGDYYGAGGGLDDRFDFILLSENLFTNNDLKYVNGSYKAYGNNGNCFNKKVNDVSCTGYYSQAIRDILYNMSDHLPVVLQLQTDQVLSITDNQVHDAIVLINGNLIKDEIILQIDPVLLNNYIDIYNTIGQKVKTLSLTNTTQHINATNFTKGIYYISLRNSESRAILKFIKL